MCGAAFRRLYNSLEIRFADGLRWSTFIADVDKFGDYLYEHLPSALPAEGGSYELIYPQADRFKYQFDVMRVEFTYAHDAADHATIRVLKIEILDAVAEKAFYRRFAVFHDIRSAFMEFSADRKVFIAGMPIKAISVSGATFAKLRLKHDIDTDTLERLLNNLRGATKAARDYIGTVGLDGALYKLFFVIAEDGEVFLKTAYMDRGRK